MDLLCQYYFRVFFIYVFKLNSKCFKLLDILCNILRFGHENKIIEYFLPNCSYSFERKSSSFFT